MRVQKLCAIFLSMALGGVGCSKSPWFQHTRGGDLEDPLVILNAEESKTYELMNHEVQARWLEGPFGDPMEASTLVLYLRDAQTGRLKSLEEPYELFVYGWHTSMGHGTASDGDTLELERGVYLNSSLRFNMPGDWDVFVQIYEGDTLLDEFDFGAVVR